ncbi:MAG: SEC-C metal-binding domain-containing protein [Campylobacterota bacterium]|nr:SEC-C metal-binding domain-containing protein [Campylobacterota bacterium]
MGIDGLDYFEKYIFENPELYGLIGIFDGIEYMLETEPNSSNRIEAMMIRYLENEKTHPVALSFAITSLVTLGKDRHIDLIRKTYKTKDVDELMCGDIESIEIHLGLRKEKTKLNVFQDNIEPFSKVGRNDPCPCGSGKKYKKCCIGR